MQRIEQLQAGTTARFLLAREADIVGQGLAFGTDDPENFLFARRRYFLRVGGYLDRRHHFAGRRFYLDKLVHTAQGRLV
ncbi:hypothetical protein D3C74_394290 [compost metagenome]